MCPCASSEFGPTHIYISAALTIGRASQDLLPHLQMAQSRSAWSEAHSSVLKAHYRNKASQI